MTKFIPFYYDEKGFYQNDKSFMITGNHLAYLTAFLNSSLFKFCFLDNFPELQGGTRELRKIFFDKVIDGHLRKPVKLVEIFSFAAFQFFKQQSQPQVFHFFCVLLLSFRFIYDRERIKFSFFKKIFEKIPEALKGITCISGIILFI